MEKRGRAYYDLLSVDAKDELCMIEVNANDRWYSLSLDQKINIY